MWDVCFDIETNLALENDEISMNNPRPPKNKDILPEALEFDWIITLQPGQVSFKSVWYELNFREKPILLLEQFFGLVK